MGTSLQDVTEWYDYGVENDKTHMLVVCDTYDHTDFPVYVGKTEKVQDVCNRNNGTNMQRVMEVYDLSLAMDKQKMFGRFCWSMD